MSAYDASVWDRPCQLFLVQTEKVSMAPDDRMAHFPSDITYSGMNYGPRPSLRDFSLKISGNLKLHEKFVKEGFSQVLRYSVTFHIFQMAWV